MKVGDTYGSWTVTEVLSPSRVKARCPHGEWIRQANHLTSGASRGCRLCMGRRHTKYKSSLARALQARAGNARQRCTNPNHPSYPAYGGRGIEFRFESLDAYVNYVMELPGVDPKLEVDRIDNDGHYEPGNLRWTSRKAQSSNRQNNRWIEWDGKQMILTDFVKNYTKLSWANAHERLRRGYTLAELVDGARILEKDLPYRKRRSVTWSPARRAAYERTRQCQSASAARSAR